MASLSRQAGSKFKGRAVKNSMWIECQFTPIEEQPQTLALLEACAKTRDPRLCARLHEDIRRNGLLHQYSDALISMYARCGELTEARKLLDRRGNADVFAWNALISGFVRLGNYRNALYYYDMMQHQGLSPNAMTFACVLKACSREKLLDRGEEIHDKITEQGLLKNNVALGNAVVTMYAKCGALARARLVLDGLPVRNVVSWNALITGYIEQCEVKESLDCFQQMQSEGVHPNPVTFACILKACGIMQALDKGESIHEEISKQGILESDIVLGTALVSMYAKCGALLKARLVLEELHTRDLMTWTAVISGYSDHGEFSEAFSCFELMKLEGLYPDVCSWTSVIAGFTERDENIQALHCFDQMRRNGILPDAATYACVLKACGSMGASSKGEEIHNEISQQGRLQNNVMLGTALVDMYARCGALRKAQEVLEEISERDAISWTALITGLMQQGRSTEALNCFCKMQHEGLLPDAVVLACIITACVQSGLVEDAQNCLVNMSSKYGTDPDLRHYTGMVNAFGHLGQLDEALKVTNSIMSFDSKLWSVLLSACQKWGNVSCGRFFFNQAVQLK